MTKKSEIAYRPDLGERSWGTCCLLLAKLEPTGQTDIRHSLIQMAAMLRHHSLVMIFSDLLEDTEQTIDGLRQLRHGGHDVILFHILDEAEVTFPFSDLMELEDPETHEKLLVDGPAYQQAYVAELSDYRQQIQRECVQSGIDYIPLDTSMPFDKALMEYLLSRQARF